MDVRGISKTFGKRRVLNNISFQINSGEIFGFLGPNGSGKTTTIKMILGLLKLDSGQIYIDGHNIKTDFEEAMTQVGGIIENPEMYSYLSGKANLKLYCNIYDGISEDRITEVVRMVKLENRINDKIRKYSLGMRQRLGLAQAMLHKPKLLILDEPTNGLDPAGIKDLRDMLRYLVENEGVSVLVSSHLLAEMELMCDRVGIIDNGHMVDVKTISEMKHSSNNGSDQYQFEISIKNYPENEVLQMISNYKVLFKNGSVIVECKKEDVPDINKILVQNGIDVFGISVYQRSLEEAFIEATNGANGQVM